MLTVISMTDSGFPPVLGMDRFFLLTMLGAGSKSCCGINAPPLLSIYYLQHPVSALTEEKEPAPEVGAIAVMGLDLALQDPWAE